MPTHASLKIPWIPTRVSSRTKCINEWLGILHQLLFRFRSVLGFLQV